MMLTPYVLFSPGKLVYERIFSMCVDNRSVLPGNVIAVPAGFILPSSQG